MKLWYVEHKVQPKRGERKVRVWRYYVLAESAEQARTRVLEDKALPDEGVDVEVAETDTEVVSVGLVFRDAEPQLDIALTKAQREALWILSNHKDGTASIVGRLRESFRILRRLGFATSETRKPSYLTYWTITDAGRAALKDGAK